jgi:DNA replication ATP-dependent helicase Dna2
MHPLFFLLFASFFKVSGRDVNSIQDYSDLLMNIPLVATTCLGIRHPIFKKRKFDYCIVDEAGQVTEPITLGPLRMAQKFILVGDHMQLRPIVHHQLAKEGGMEISLFERLADEHSQVSFCYYNLLFYVF